MSNINKQVLTNESARESGNILLIVAARMARRELFTPLHFVSELPQKVVSMRVFREALERSEETLQREVCKIVDGHRLMEKKLKEAETKLEAAEKRIAEVRGYNVDLAEESRQYQQRVAELEQQLIKPLPIGELLQRLENQTGDPWGQKYLTEFEVRQVALPTFDGYVPHVAEELQAAFRIACDGAGISIKGE